MPTLTTILFDADGVIQRAPDDLRRRLVAALGADAGDLDACLTDIWAAEAPALTGGADFAETLVPVLAKWKSRNDVAAFLAQWLTIEVISVLALVAELRAAGVHCAIASNQEPHRARHMSEIMGYRGAFDGEFYSCHLGHAKPSAGYFAEVVRQGGFDPARTLFIDDRQDNVAAARAAGLHAEHFVLGEMGTGAAALRELLAPYAF